MREREQNFHAPVGQVAGGDVVNHIHVHVTLIVEPFKKNHPRFSNERASGKNVGWPITRPIQPINKRAA